MKFQVEIDFHFAIAVRQQMRLSATKALLERKDAIIVASVSAIYGLGDPESYLKMMLLTP